jgi:hypothetical protein
VSPSDVVAPPPTPRIVDYPGAVTITFVVVFTIVLMFMSDKFDPTGGALTLSLLVVLAFLAAVVFCAFFTIPTDEITSAVFGGLIAAFGAVMAHWLGRPREPK